MKLAVFSDIHGNLHGLRAVLADVHAQGADLIWCGGDLVGYGAQPGEVVELIQSLGIPTVMGNYDDAVGFGRPTCGCNYTDEQAMANGLQSVAWTKAHTNENHKRYLRSLPYQFQRPIAGHQVVLVHGSPAELNEYLFAETSDERFETHLVSTGADVLVFGHTHKPYHKVLKGKHLINSGSAGKPKHGNPNATYVMITLNPESVEAEIREVPYDYEAAAKLIEASELPHLFAQLLRHG
jgi:putative phosphoesterase